MDLFANNIGGLKEFHPFRNVNGFVWIPDKYKTIYQEIYDNISNIPFNEYEINKLIWNYISIFWIDSWYNDEAVTFTPKTYFYDWNFKDNVNFDTPKFARLNSVSSKTLSKVTTLVKAKCILNDSERCNNLVSISKQYNLPLNIAIREWIDIYTGAEYRCFVYNNKLCAICPHGIYDLEINDKELIERISLLLYKARYHLPFEDCIVDVFLSEKSNKLDCIIEFNSYGIWANSTSGAFNWITDKYELENLPVTIKGRHSIENTFF